MEDEFKKMLKEEKKVDYNRHLKLSKKDRLIYLKYSLFFGMILFLCLELFNLIGSYVISLITQSTIWSIAVLGFLSLVITGTLVFFAIVKIEKKVKKLLPVTMSSYTLIILILIRQLFLIIVYLARGNSWSSDILLSFLMPRGALLIFLTLFIVPIIYDKFRKSQLK